MDETRGVKRKRQAAFQKPALDLSTKFSGKLHSSLKEVQRAGKKAKAYETQRIVKRLKNGAKTAEDTLQLENELKALKILDTDVMMRSALLTRVKNDGVLGRDERVQTAMDNVSDASGRTKSNEKNTPEAKIEARIRSSKKVAEVMKGCLESLRNLVLDKTKEERQVDQEDEGEDEDEEPFSGVQATTSDGADGEETTATETFLGTTTGAGTDDEREADGFDDVGWESGSLAGELDEGSDVGADGNSDEWESGSVSANEGEAPSKKARLKSNPTKDLPQKAPVVESTFLPSLSVGYIAGDSSADQWSDDDKSLPERKNRRGQRARRAIWEKKFGKHANHVKKHRAVVDAKNNARQARLALARQRSRQQQALPRPRMPFQQNTSDVNPNTIVAKPLHPSWVAKRKALDKQSKASVAGAAQGTKIKF